MGKFDEKTILKKKKKMKKQEEERVERRKNAFVRRHSTYPGTNLFRLFETKTKGKFPWEEMGIHYGCGPDGKTSFRCIRNHVDEKAKNFQPINDCPQCKDCQKLYDKGTKSSKAKAGRMNRKERILLEALDFTPLVKFFEKDKVPLKPKECFGNFVFRESDEGHAKCAKCVEKTSWGKICSIGMGYLTIGPTIGGPMVSQAYKIHKSMHHNPFSPVEGHNFEFSRSGEELNTTYSDIGWSLESYGLPEVIAKFAEENSLNWEEIYPKPSKDEMLSKMRGVEEEPEDEEKELGEEEDEESEDEESEDEESEGEEDESETSDEDESETSDEDESEDDEEEDDFMKEIEDELGDDEEDENEEEKEELGDDEEDENEEEKEELAKKLKAQARAKKKKIKTTGKKKES